MLRAPPTWHISYIYMYSVPLSKSKAGYKEKKEYDGEPGPAVL